MTQTKEQKNDPVVPGARLARGANVISIFFPGILLFWSAVETGWYPLNSLYDGGFGKYLEAANCNWQEAEAAKLCVQTAATGYDQAQSELAFASGSGALVVASIMLILVGFRACAALFTPSWTRLVVSLLALTVLGALLLYAIVRVDIDVVMNGKTLTAVVIIILGTLSQDLIPLWVGRRVKRRSANNAQDAALNLQHVSGQTKSEVSQDVTR